MAPARLPLHVHPAGTSPEFELALYTTFFLCGEEKNFIELGRYDLDIVCYRISSKYGDKVSGGPGGEGVPPTAY